VEVKNEVSNHRFWFRMEGTPNKLFLGISHFSYSLYNQIVFIGSFTVFLMMMFNFYSSPVLNKLISIKLID